MRRNALAYAFAAGCVFLLFHTDHLILKAAALIVLLAVQGRVALKLKALRLLLLADLLVAGFVSALLIVSPTTFVDYRWGWLAHALAVCLLLAVSAGSPPASLNRLVGFSVFALPGALLMLPPHYTLVDLLLVLWILGGLPLLGAGLLGGEITLINRVPRRAVLLVAIVLGCAVMLRSIRAFPNFSATDEAIVYNYVDTFERTGKIDASLVPYPAPVVTGNLYVYAATLWLRAFPTDPYALRTLSALAGIALIGVTFLAGRALSDSLTAGIAAALLSTNLLWTAVAHVGRQEMALALCIWLAVWLALEAQRRESLMLALLAGLIVALSADMHPLGALACVALGGWWLVWAHSQANHRLAPPLRPQRLLLAFVIGGMIGTVYYLGAHVLPDPVYFFAGVRDELVSYGAESSTPLAAMMARHLNYIQSNPLEIGLLLLCAVVGMRQRTGRRIALLVGAFVVLYGLLVADPNPYYPIVWMPGVIVCAALGLRQAVWRWRAPMIVALLASFAFNAALIERHVGANWNGSALDAIQQVGARVDNGAGLSETFLYLALRESRALRDADFTGFTFVNYEATLTGSSGWDVVERLAPGWIVTMQDESDFRPQFDVMSVDVPHMRLEIPVTALANHYRLEELITTSVGVFEIWRRS